MTKLAALVALVAFSGCSIALQSKPASPRAHGPAVSASCSTTPAYWIADSVGAVLGFGTFVTGFAVGGDSAHTDRNYAVAGAAGFAGLIYLASALNGRTWTAECRENHEQAPAAAPVAAR